MKCIYSRCRRTLDIRVEVVLIWSPIDTRFTPDAERRRKMNVDPRRRVSEGNRVDVVRRVETRGPDCWWFVETSESLAISVDRLVNPIAYGYLGSCIRIIGADVASLELVIVPSGSSGRYRGEEERGDQDRHCEGLVRRQARGGEERGI